VVGAAIELGAAVLHLATAVARGAGRIVGAIRPHVNPFAHRAPG
jgi:hypothetical protein